MAGRVEILVNITFLNNLFITRVWVALITVTLYCLVESALQLGFVYVCICVRVYIRTRTRARACACACVCVCVYICPCVGMIFRVLVIKQVDGYGFETKVSIKLTSVSESPLGPRVTFS